MKKFSLLLVVFCLVLAGCSGSRETGSLPVAEAAVETTAATLPTESAKTIYPLPDTTMDHLTDATLSVSLEEGKAYVDDTGKMQMDLKIYSCDLYDMVDISMLKVGDTILRHSGEVEVTALERTDTGTIRINGGLDNGGFDLVTDDSGVYYEMGYNDHKNWYEAGEATIRVSTEFIFIDNADLDNRDAIFYPGSFLIGEVTNYDFTPYNTTVRVEEGQIVEMNRRYIP